MNRRSFIARMIGGLVTAVTAEPILAACKAVSVEPDEVRALAPRWVMIELDKLRADTSVTRQCYPESVRLLAESIGQQGLMCPITITMDNTIIDGVHRVEACRHIGMKIVRALQLDVTVIEAHTIMIEKEMRNNLHYPYYQLRRE